jgi:hypothetical protein
MGRIPWKIGDFITKQKGGGQGPENAVKHEVKYVCDNDYQADHTPECLDSCGHSDPREVGNWFYVATRKIPGEVRQCQKKGRGWNWGRSQAAASLNVLDMRERRADAALCLCGNLTGSTGEQCKSCRLGPCDTCSNVGYCKQEGKVACEGCFYGPCSVGKCSKAGSRILEGKVVCRGCFFGPCSVGKCTNDGSREHEGVVVCSSCFISQQTGGLIRNYYQLQKFNSALVDTAEAGNKIDVGAGLPPAQPYLTLIKVEALRLRVTHYTPSTITIAAITEVLEREKAMKELLEEMYEEGLWAPTRNRLWHSCSFY